MENVSKKCYLCILLSRMKKYLKDIVKLIIFLALGFFFVWLSLKDLTPEDRSQLWINARNAFSGNGWIFLVLCALIGILSVWLRGRRSVIMLEPMNYHVKSTMAYHSVMIGYLANLAIPRLGEILRCTILQKYEHVPFQKSFGTVVTERVLDVLICGLVFVAAFILESDRLTTIFVENHVADNIVNMLSGVTKYIVIAGLILIIVLIYIFRKWVLQFKIVQKIKQVLLGFWEGLISIKNTKHPVRFIVYSLSIWVCYYFMFFVATFAFPELVSTLGVRVALASLSCVVIGTLGFIVAQGGLGAYPLLVSMVLALYGMGAEVGLAVGWVIWAVESAMYLMMGLLSLVVISFTHETTRTETVENHQN